MNSIFFSCGTIREFCSSCAISARTSSTSRARATSESWALSSLTTWASPWRPPGKPTFINLPAAACPGFLSSWPKNLSAKLAAAAEFASFHAAARFYKIPRLLFAPNRELVELLGKATGKPCFLMSHSVNTEIFSPAFRERSAGPFRIGYVGRLTPEKNVRFLAQLERDLLAKGNRDFRIVLIGEGSEEKWLRENMQHAEFSGWLTGQGPFPRICGHGRICVPVGNGYVWPGGS